MEISDPSGIAILSARRSRPLILVVVVAVLFLAGSASVESQSDSQGTPSAPADVLGIASPNDTSVTVNWHPSAGPPASRYEVHLKEGGADQAYALCFACTSMVFPGLYPANDWEAVVYAANSAGFSPPTTSNSLIVVSGCSTAAVCLNVDATHDQGPALLRAQGFNEGVDANTPVDLVNALRPQSWRITYGPSRASDDLYAVTGKYQTTRTNVLSNLWYNATYQPYRECGGNSAMCVGFAKPWGGALTPWSDWKSYSSFLTHTVQSLVQAGSPPDYWEIHNEPGLTYYYDGDDTEATTEAELEQQLIYAYRAIKTADPNAKVVCPTLAGYVTYSREYPNETPPFSRILQFLDKNNVRCDAISWHENDPYPLPVDTTGQPETITEHVAGLRALLAQHPGLGDPKLFINEYGPSPVVPSSYLSAGWTAGRIAALEAAKVDEANSACFDCPAGTVDGLLTSDHGGTRPAYWVRAFYAKMTGKVVATSTTSYQVNSFATNDSSTQTVRVLIGRHDSRPSESVSVSITLPWSARSVTATIQHIPDGTGAINDPRPVTTVVTPGTNVVNLTLPAVANTDAYTISLTPGS
jgi:hypothetical protein